jgi:hypothetical protein
MQATKPARDILDHPYPPIPTAGLWVLVLAGLWLLTVDLIRPGVISEWWSLAVLLIVVCLLFPATVFRRRRCTRVDDVPLREQIRQWREDGGGSQET